MQFYLDYSNDELWKAAFRDKKQSNSAVKTEGKNGNKYHDTSGRYILSEDYQGSIKIKIPQGYSFPYPPTLMQRYVAYKVNTLPYFATFLELGQAKRYQRCLASQRY